MTKIKLTATLPDGTVATRTTARTYTHVIAVLPSYKEHLRRANDELAQVQDSSNWDYRASCANGTYAYPAWYSQEARDKSVAEGRAWIAENPDRAAFITGKHADRVAAVEARKAEGFYETWQAATWCGRLSLAQAQLAQLQRADGWADARMMPVGQ
jgi:hypothetical protein